MTHIFIVDEKTFDVHLKYLFAGTGYTHNETGPQTLDLASKLDKADSTEKTLVGMIADISRIREGDHVLFHVTGCKKIFGIFEIVGSPFFNKLEINYKGPELGKYLSFRIKIKPYKVYQKGITETFALNDISEIEHPYEMFWSLIYRKLTGNRGCCYLTDPESERMEALLNSINNNLYFSKGNFEYNAVDQEINISKVNCPYAGDVSLSLRIDNRLFSIKSGAFEGHLQAFITQNFDKPLLKKLLLPESYLKYWIGNEVYCSVGEQRIDILLVAECASEIIIRIIELKDEPPKVEILEVQIPWYIKWVDQYFAPNYLKKNKTIKIIPTIIATKAKRECDSKRKFYLRLNQDEVCSLNNSLKCKTELIYFKKTDNSIVFEKE